MYEPKPEAPTRTQQLLLSNALHALQRAKEKIDFLTRCEAFGAFRKRTDLEEKTVRAATETSLVVRQLWHLLDGLDPSAVGSSHEQEDQDQEAGGGEAQGGAHHEVHGEVHDLR